jgi:hypothetical protein
VLNNRRQEANVKPFPDFDDVFNFLERERVLSVRLGQRELHGIFEYVDSLNFFVNQHEDQKAYHKDDDYDELQARVSLFLALSVMLERESMGGYPTEA